MTDLLYITWDVSPFIYEGEHFAIGWYGTLWTLGLIGMLVTLLLTFKHDGIPSRYALVSFIVSLICVIFFGHLFQGLFYEWYYTADSPLHLFGTDWHYRNYYFEHPWKFFDFAHGGFASHGLGVGILLSSLYLGKRLSLSPFFIADRALIAMVFLAVCIRIGNFINGEIYGVYTFLPWGVIFASEELPSHPTQLYEALSYFFILIISTYWYLKKEYGKYDGLLTSLILLTLMSCRIIIEFLKNPQMSIESDWVLNMGQILSIPYILGSICLIKYSIKKGKSV